LAWLHPHNEPKITSDITVEELFSTINLNTFLTVKWPFTISDSLFNRLIKSSKEEVEKILTSIKSIASRSFTHTNVVATGPCVYRCSLVESVSNNDHILFSINPIFDPLKNCVKQYLRFDFWFKE
jgi:hypothetical protein